MIPRTYKYITKKIIPRFRYPKLILLLISAIAGFLIYFDQNNFHFHLLIEHSGYVGIFIAGALLSHGFTLGPGIAILLVISKNEPLLITSLIATTGAIIGNGISYNLLRISYHQELSELSKLRFFTVLHDWALRTTPRFVRRYLFPVFAGLISATPLPDEFSVVLIKASEKVSITIFTLATGIIGIFGVTIILLIGKIL